MIVIFVFLIMRFSFPYLFMDVENFIDAKFLVTTLVIDTLRSITKTLGGNVF